MTTITTPRPPLNRLLPARVAITSDWTLLLRPTDYMIPASGQTPEQAVSSVAILTNVLVANTGAGAMTVSLRVVRDGGATWSVLQQSEAIPAGQARLIDLSKQIVLSTEQLQAQASAGGTADVHVSYVLATEETFEVIV